MPITKPKQWFVQYDESEKEQYNRISGRLRAMNGLRNLKLKLLNNLSVSERYLMNQLDHVAYIGEVPDRHSWKSMVKGSQSRTKLHKLVSLVVAENLGPVVKAHNKDYTQIDALSNALTKVVQRTNEIEDLYKIGDVSDATLELLIHGTVCLEEIYDTVTDERFVGEFDPTNLAAMAASYSSEKTTTDRVYKRVLKGNAVYFGSLTVGNVQEQPDIAIRTTMSFDEARAQYGNWERWKYVESMNGKKKEELSDIYSDLNDSRDMLSALQPDEGDVEVVRYMRKNPQTFQIYLNGVQMLPPNTGFPWRYNKYNLVVRPLYQIDINFPYGSSIYDLTRSEQGVLDKIVNLIIDRENQLLEPSVSLLNKSIKATNLFRPNSVHRGINPEDIKIISTQAQMGNNAWAVVQHYNAELDKMFNPTSMGAPLTGEHSATEIIEMQKSAMKILGYLYLAVEGVVADSAWLRVHNIIANCISYKNKGKKVLHDGIRSELVPVFQEYLIDNTLLEDGKRGKMKVRFIPKNMQEKILKAETSMSDGNLTSAEKLGFQPLEVMLLKKKKAFGGLYEEVLVDPDMLQSLEWYFKVVVEQLVKNTSAFERAEFKDMLVGAVNLFGPDAVNLEYGKEEYAKTFKASDKLFNKAKEPVVVPKAQQVPNAPRAAGGDGQVLGTQDGKTPEMSNQLMASVKRRSA